MAHIGFQIPRLSLTTNITHFEPHKNLIDDTYERSTCKFDVQVEAACKTPQPFFLKDWFCLRFGRFRLVELRSPHSHPFGDHGRTRDGRSAPVTGWTVGALAAATLSVAGVLAPGRRATVEGVAGTALASRGWASHEVFHHVGRLASRRRCPCSLGGGDIQQSH